jgi:hypothetical protein
MGILFAWWSERLVAGKADNVMVTISEGTDEETSKETCPSPIVWPVPKMISEPRILKRSLALKSVPVFVTVMSGPNSELTPKIYGASTDAVFAPVNITSVLVVSISKVKAAMDTAGPLTFVNSTSKLLPEVPASTSSGDCRESFITSALAETQKRRGNKIPAISSFGSGTGK